MAEPMTLHSLNGLGVDQKDFFTGAKTGNKKTLKKLMDTGRIQDVDIKNEEGQTPLFYACYEGEDEAVKFLLEKGANANEPSEHGHTPLHAACYRGCIKSVSSLVERGGDFRFHDKEHRTGKDWAMLNPNAKKRQAMTEYIVKTRMFAMTHSGRDVLLERQSSAYMRRPSDNTGSVGQLFKRISSKGGKGEHIKLSASMMSLGYGKVYGGEMGGTMSTIPMIAESMLKHDDFGTTFMNNAYFVMEGMMLGPTKVTVKRLHHDPPKGAVVDHLIRECENISMIATLRPEERASYPTPSTHSLKRKLEAILSQDSGDFSYSKRPNIPSSVLQENGCRPITPSPQDEKEKVAPLMVNTSNLTAIKPSLPTVTSMTSTRPSSFVDRSTPFNFACPPPGPMLTTTTDLNNYSNPYNFLPPISQFTQPFDNNLWSPQMPWGHIPVSCPPAVVPSYPNIPQKQSYSKCDDGATRIASTSAACSGAALSTPLTPVYSSAKTDDHHEALELQQSTIGSSQCDEPYTTSNSVCQKCKGKDELLDVQQNMILHLQHIVAVTRMTIPMQNAFDMNYMRLSVRQGKIPRSIAEKNQMFEILVLGEYQSGVFLSNSFKYELEINHSDRGTLMAKKMLHAFYTEYDLAYAGNLQGRGSSPGIHYDILTSIECFVGSRAKKCYERTAVRATLSSEITAAKRNRESKGLKLFQRDRLLENPNNVLPKPDAINVVADINEVMNKPAEKDYHLRHPNVLLLMATCATDNMEGMVLVFERIYFGSLYNYLHEKNQQPAPHAIIEAGLQLVEGLIYIHQNNFIHNYISSHSVYLTNTNTLKIGNFEYLVPMTIGGKSARVSRVSLNKYLNATYNWLPPELIKGDLSTEKSDIYGFCAVMWEMFTGFIPWAGHDAEQIEKQVCNQKMLKVNDPRVPAKLVEVLHYGLQPTMTNRKMNLEQIRDVISLLPRGRQKPDRQGSPAQQPNNNCSVEIYETIDSTLDSPVSSKRSHTRRTQTRRRHTKSFHDEHPTEQLLKCNHHTQTLSDREMTWSQSPEGFFVPEACSEPPPLKPLRRKQFAPSQHYVPDTGSEPASSLTYLTDIDAASQSSQERYNLRQARRNRRAQEKIQLCIALKEPLHHELKMYYNQVKQDMTSQEGGGDTCGDKPEELLDEEQMDLQKQLNHELRSVFSNSILFSQNEEESDNFASLNLDELSDPLEADTAEGLNDFPVIDGGRVNAVPSTEVRDRFISPMKVSPQYREPRREIRPIATYHNNANRPPPHFGTALYRPTSRKSKSLTHIISGVEREATAATNHQQGREVTSTTSLPKPSVSSSSLGWEYGSRRYEYNIEGVKPAGHCTLARPLSVRSSGDGSLKYLLSGSSLPPAAGEMREDNSQSNTNPNSVSWSQRVIKASGKPSGGHDSEDTSVSLSGADPLQPDAAPIVRPVSYRSRGEPYHIVDTSRSEGYQRYKPGWLLMDKPRTYQAPSHSEGDDGRALRYSSNSSGVITNQKPVVQMIKKLEKPFGQCQNSTRVRGWREAAQREGDAASLASSAANSVRPSSNRPSLSYTRSTAASNLVPAEQSHRPVRVEEAVRQTPSARSTCSSITDSSSTYGSRVSERKRLFEVPSSKPAINPGLQAKTTPRLCKNKYGAQAVSVAGAANRSQSGTSSASTISSHDSAGGAVGGAVPGSQRICVRSPEGREASIRPILGREQAVSNLRSATSSEVTDVPDVVVLTDVKSFVDTLEKTYGNKSPRVTSSSNHSQDDSMSGRRPVSNKPSSRASTDRADGVIRNVSIVAVMEQKAEDSQYDGTDTTQSIHNKISSFQELANKHERKQSHWRRYGGDVKPASSTSISSMSQDSESTGHRVASTPKLAAAISHVTDIAKGTPIPCHVAAVTTPDISPCSSAEVMEHGRNVSVSDLRSPPEISLSASHIIQVINGTAAGLSSPDDDSHTTRSNTVSSVAGGAGPVGGNMTMLTSTAADIDVLDDKISQCEQKISQDTSVERLTRQLILAESDDNQSLSSTDHYPTERPIAIEERIHPATAQHRGSATPGSPMNLMDILDMPVMSSEVVEDEAPEYIARWNSQPKLDDKTADRWDSSKSYSNDESEDEESDVEGDVLNEAGSEARNVKVEDSDEGDAENPSNEEHLNNNQRMIRNPIDTAEDHVTSDQQDDSESGEDDDCMDEFGSTDLGSEVGTEPDNHCYTEEMMYGDERESRPGIIPGVYISEEGDRTSQLSLDNPNSARFTTPQETPRDSISGAGSFYNTPDCSPRIYSRHHSEGDATPSVNNSDADNTVTLEEASSHSVAVDENNNPIEPSDMAKVRNLTVTDCDSTDIAVPSLDLTCMPVSEHVLPAKEAPAGNGRNTESGSRCKLAVSLHDGDTDKLKQQMEVVFERDVTNPDTPRAVAKSIMGDISAVQASGELGVASFVGPKTSVKVASAFVESKDKASSKQHIFLEIKQSGSDRQICELEDNLVEPRSLSPSRLFLETSSSDTDFIPGDHSASAPGNYRFKSHFATAREPTGVNELAKALEESEATRDCSEDKVNVCTEDEVAEEDNDNSRIVTSTDHLDVCITGEMDSVTVHHQDCADEVSSKHTDMNNSVTGDVMGPCDDLLGPGENCQESGLSDGDAVTNNSEEGDVLATNEDSSLGKNIVAADEGHHDTVEQVDNEDDLCDTVTETTEPMTQTLPQQQETGSVSYSGENTDPAADTHVGQEDVSDQRQEDASDQKDMINVDSEQDLVDVAYDYDVAATTTTETDEEDPQGWEIEQSFDDGESDLLDDEVERINTCTKPEILCPTNRLINEGRCSEGVESTQSRLSESTEYQDLPPSLYPASSDVLSDD